MLTIHRIPPGLVAALAGIAVLMPALALAQDPLKLNVPYRCTDGITRTVTRCATNERGGEVCFWTEVQNGQSNDRFNVRSQMDGWLKTCTATDAAPARLRRPQHPRAAQRRPPPAAQATPPSQTPNPPYLAGFPSVEKVKSDVRGSSAGDTLARQVATFDALEKVLQKMRAPTGFLPDESRIYKDYYTAQQDIGLKGTEKLSGADMATYRQQLARYEGDPAFATNALSLLSPAARAQVAQVTGIGAGATQAASAQPAQTGNPQFVRNDAGTVAARRCLELGGSELECIAKGISTGFDDLTGIKINALLEANKARGIRLGGAFKTASGETLGFRDDLVNIASCGKLEPQGINYSVTRRGDTLQVDITTAPKPLVVTLGPDGRLTGPASFMLDGQVIVGYQNVWVEQRRVSDNTIVPGTGHYEQRPVYENRTERCAFGSLGASAPVYGQTSVTSQVVALAEGRTTPQSQRADTAEAPAGARMSGKYGMAGGLQIVFEPTQAVLDCGDAHAVQPYATKNLPDRFVVTVQNGSGPIALTLRPDGALSGSGTVEVVGRVVSGTNATGVTYTPKTARCSVSVLAPQ